jgi:hypothetical protein
VVLVGVFLGEAPRSRAHGRIEDDARAERIPRVRATVCEEDLAHPARGELIARITYDADSNDRDVEIVAVRFGHAPHGALRDSALADDAIDARDDLRPVRQRHGPRVELSEVA